MKRKHGSIRKEEVEEWEQRLSHSTYKVGTFAFEQVSTALMRVLLGQTGLRSIPTTTDYPFNNNNGKMVILIL